MPATQNYNLQRGVCFLDIFLPSHWALKYFFEKAVKKQIKPQKLQYNWNQAVKYVARIAIWIFTK